MRIGFVLIPFDAVGIDCYASVGKAGIAMLPSSDPYFSSTSINNLPRRQRWLLHWFCLPAIATIVASYIDLVGPERMISNVSNSPLGSFHELGIFGIVTLTAAMATPIGLRSTNVAKLSRPGRVIGGTVFGALLLRVEYFIGVDQPLRFLLMMLCSVLIAWMIEWHWLRFIPRLAKSADKVENLD